MGRKSRKLLEKMRASHAGWKVSSIHSLYTGFGFDIDTSSGRHDKVTHSQLPGFMTMLPRHNDVLSAYVREAVKNVDALLEKLSLTANNQAVDDEDDTDDTD